MGKKVSVFKPNKHLVPLKALLFLYNGAYACLLPYLAVHMRHIGISVEETAIIHSLLPIAAFSGPPVAGFLADKFGGYKLILIFSLIANGLLHSALLAVPSLRTEIYNPLDEIHCLSDRSFLRVNTCEDSTDCQLIINGTINGDLKSTECTYHCTNDPQKGPIVTSAPKGLPSHSSGESCGSSLNGTCNPAQFRSSSNNNGSYSSHKNFTNDIRLRISSACRRIDKTGCSYDVHEMWNPESEEDLSCPKVNSSCRLICPVRLEDNNLSSEKQCEKTYGNHTLTFWLYLVLRVIASAFLSSCLSLLDATTLVMLKEHDGEYGKQRMWSILATAVFPPIAGVLVDYASLIKGYNDYSPTFYTFDVLILCTVLLTWRLDLHIKWESDTKIKDVLKLLKKLEVNMLLLAILVLGTMWGFIETFLYWYLLDLGSPKYLLGLTLTVGSGVSVPVMYTAEKIVKKVGHANVLSGACFIYCLRYLGYSFIYNAWWALVFELMEVFTIHLMWVAAITYGAALSSESVLATVQGTICGVHYGMGRGLGSFIGGTLMSHFGARFAYRCMGSGCAVFGALYLVFSLTYLRRKDMKDSKEKEKSTPLQVFTAKPPKECEADAEAAQAMLRNNV